MSSRQTILNDAKSVIDGAKSAGRSMTDVERKSVQRALDTVKRLDAESESRKSDELRRELADCLRADLPPESRKATSVGTFSAKTATHELAAQINGGGTKALAPSGSVVAPAGLTVRTPVELGRVATSLLSVIPAEVVSDPPNVDYLRQTTRTNNAAAVADGALKPTSAYGLERVDDRLRVIAHLSESVPKFWLADLSELSVFLDNELRYGLDLAVEQQLLTGDGLGENMRGILNTSGIQMQAWSVDGYETIRRALTKLQIAGASEFVVALSPVDFEAMNLVRSTTGEFLATESNYQSDTGGATSPPYGPAALRSWGARIVLSNALAAGTGVAFDPAAMTLYTDGQITVEWNQWDGFDTNEIKARCEGRFLSAVKRPLSVVSLDMSAAA